MVNILALLKVYMSRHFGKEHEKKEQELIESLNLQDFKREYNYDVYTRPKDMR